MARTTRLGDRRNGEPQATPVGDLIQRGTVGLGFLHELRGKNAREPGHTCGIRSCSVGVRAVRLPAMSRPTRRPNMQSSYSFTLLCAATLLIGACAGTAEDDPSGSSSDSEEGESSESAASTGRVYHIYGTVFVSAASKGAAAIIAQDQCIAKNAGYTYNRVQCAGVKAPGLWTGSCVCQGSNDK